MFKGRQRRYKLSVITALVIVSFYQLTFLSIGKAEIVIVEGFLPTGELGSYSDTDKWHNSGSWSSNYYNDLNSNNLHDPGEAISDNYHEGWKTAADNSCWLASACNMLKQAGLIDNAEMLYSDYATNGVPDYEGNILTFDDGGLQEYAINYFKNQNPQICSNLQMQILQRSTTVHFTNGVYAWTDINPISIMATYLAENWQIGIGMWPLIDSTGYHEGGHALTIQEIGAGNFLCSDSDRDKNGEDLNTYQDVLIGPVYYEGHNYYGFYNDYYSGNIGYYPVGDLGYICAITAPEPATILLMSIAAGLIIRRKS